MDSRPTFTCVLYIACYCFVIAYSDNLKPCLNSRHSICICELLNEFFKFFYKLQTELGDHLMSYPFLRLYDPLEDKENNILYCHI